MHDWSRGSGSSYYLRVSNEVNEETLRWESSRIGPQPHRGSSRAAVEAKPE